MSDSTFVFVDTTISLADFISELEPLLGLTFIYTTDPYDTWYDFDDAALSLRVYENDYLSDGVDCPFEEYRLVIDVHAKRVINDKPEDWQNELASEIFQKLKATNKYRLLLVWNLQVPMETFDPLKKL